MRLINSNTSVIPQGKGLLGVYRQIERAGRTAYKSEDKITEDSAEKFVNMLINRGHLAPLEFGTIYLQIPTNIDPKIISFYDVNSYSRINYDDEWYYVTTNARVIIESERHDDLKWLCNLTKNHDERITAAVTCSRSVANEIVRHRTFSYVQESTRYCNYSKDKFSGQITFIIPHWMDIKEGEYSKPYYSALDDKFHIYYRELNSSTDYQNLLFGKDIPYKFLYRLEIFGQTEEEYFKELNANGLTPQDARDCLPLGLKTEIVICGFKDAWDHFFTLRCASDAHPDMQIIANKIKEELCL